VTILLPRFVSVGPVDVNRASVDELVALPGIGPVLAARIVAYREEHGMFRTLDELQKVSGIGRQTVDGLREKAVVSGESADQ
ncbi:MAG TPA: helix-hairpin-helix domain-containing protein, partial [Candidatus Acetothermia bacterium]|nr:helix-hairpin-helix domain-containing protein [Candidatus Acetothermia bacterium]